MQHPQQGGPILPPDGGNLALGDVFLKWVSQLFQDSGNFGIDVFLKPIAWIDPMIQPLEDDIEVLLRRGFEDVWVQGMFHHVLEIVLGQIVDHFLPHLDLVASRLERPWISRRCGGDWRLIEECLLSHESGGRWSRVHTAPARQVLGGTQRRLHVQGRGISRRIARPGDRASYASEQI